MKLETQIAQRYLLKSGQGNLGSLLAVIALLGVIVSVFSLLSIQFVMTAFSKDVRSKILHFSSPLVLTPTDPTLFAGKSLPEMPKSFQSQKLFPYLETEGVIRTGDEAVQGLKIKGLDLQDPILTQKLKVDYEEGYSLNDLPSKEEVLPGIILGVELAKRLNIYPSLNEEVDLIYPFGDVDPSGEMRPRVRRFRVIGTFKSGYYEYDNKFAILALGEARRLIPATEVPTQWALQDLSIFESQKKAEELNQFFSGKWKAESWGEHNKKLLTSLQLERFTMTCVLALMIIIATFNIFSLIMMIVVDKQKEIAVFRAMGLAKNRVVSIFTRIALLIGSLGAVIGSSLAILAALILKWYPLKMPTPYYLDNLPIQIDVPTLIIVLLLAPLFSFLAAWYPAYRGGRFEISDSLRYE